MVTTAIAPTNIAILKYWGKNPALEEYLVPTKSSLSFTVDGLYTTTTVRANKSVSERPKIDFELNGKTIAKGMKEYEYVEDFLLKIGKFFPFVGKYDYRIVSKNNFPTSAGFASSASGFAALIKAMAGEIPEFEKIKNDDAKLSALARLGSGSAARSIPSKGGVVLWKRGIDYKVENKRKMSEGEIERVMFASFAETIFGPDHWKDLSIIYVKVRAEEKKVKSRKGMKESVETNPLYPAWIEYDENIVKELMVEAIRKKDFGKLAELIMKSSNNFHQICMGTYPPLVYLNSISFDIINKIHDLNSEIPKAAYTFDAGPNAVIFTLKKFEPEIIGELKKIVGDENVILSGVGTGTHFSADNLFE